MHQVCEPPINNIITNTIKTYMKNSKCLNSSESIWCGSGRNNKESVYSSGSILGFHVATLTTKVVVTVVDETMVVAATKATFMTLLHLVLQLREFRTKSVDNLYTANKQKIPVKPQCVSTDLYCITITQTQRLSARTYEFLIASANINIEHLL